MLLVRAKMPLHPVHKGGTLAVPQLTTAVYLAVTDSFAMVPCEPACNLLRVVHVLTCRIPGGVLLACSLPWTADRSADICTTSTQGTDEAQVQTIIMTLSDR